MTIPNTAPPDSVEFPCTSCGHRLRAPSSAVGRQARCPQCGTVQPVTPQQAEATLPQAGIDEYGVAPVSGGAPSWPTAGAASPAGAAGASDVNDPPGERAATISADPTTAPRASAGAAS